MNEYPINLLFTIIDNHLFHSNNIWHFYPFISINRQKIHLHKRKIDINEEGASKKSTNDFLEAPSSFT